MPIKAGQARVNIRTAVNSSAIRTEMRNGREKIVVPSATLPDGVVMNGIKYPAAEIAKSYKTLNGTPAPLGHPTLDGQFLPANSTEAHIRFGIGAYNENARQEGGRVLVDKVIDKEYAQNSTRGKRVLEAVENGSPIHTSTGLLCMLQDGGENAEGFTHIATDIVFDHDAILLDEDGAATPEQGVGMMVNEQAVQVVNSDLAERVEEEWDWAAQSVAQALERQARLPLLESIKIRLMEAFGAQPETEEEESTMDKDLKAEFEALGEQLDKVTQSLDGIGDTIANALSTALQPVVEATNAAKAAAEADAKAKRSELVNKLVEAKVFDSAAEADGMPDPALNKLLSVAEAKGFKGKAAGLNSADNGPTGTKKAADRFAPPKAVA